MGSPRARAPLARSSPESGELDVAGSDDASTLPPHAPGGARLDDVDPFDDGPLSFDEPEPRAPRNPAVRRARAAISQAPVVSATPAVSAPLRRNATATRDLSKTAADGAPPSVYARGRELAALLYVSVALFLTLALASYDERGGADWVGLVGARFAHLTVSALGVVAWAIPVELSLFAVPYLRGRPNVLTVSRAAGDIVLAATAAALVHVGAMGRTFFGGHVAGGVIGELFGELLRALFSTIGTFLVGLTVIALVLIARAAFSFIDFAHRTGRTTAVAANRARASVLTVAEAWREAREIERAGGAAPELVREASDVSRAVRESELPPDPSNDRSEIRMRKDVGIDREASAIARKLAGVADADDEEGPDAPAARAPSKDLESALFGATPSPAGSSAIAARPTSDAIAPTIVLEAEAPKSRARSRKKKDESEPTIAAPPPEAALWRASANERADHDDARPADPAGEDAARADASSSAIELAAAQASASSPVAPEAAAIEADESLDPADAADAADSADHAEDLDALDESGAADALEAGDDADESTPLDASPLPARAVAPPKPKPAPRKIYRLPSESLLDPPPPDAPAIDREALLADAKALVATLNTYKVVGEVREIHPGPVVTTFEFEPRIGTKVREVEGLANDLRLSLAKESVRIIAPIPGKNRIGFELPNLLRVPVNFRELVEDRRFAEAKGALPVVLGRDIVGAPYYADLAAMPHLLVAGATGAGKSVGLNVMLTSLLYRRTPDDLKMIMIDPKVVELAPFDRIPHMLLPVVTDMKQALNALKWAVDEMERRYQLLAKAGVKNIGTYNQWREKIARGELPNPMPKTITAIDHNGLPEEIATKDQSIGEQQLPEKLPYLVIVVDEFADLMMSVGKGEVEPPVARLAQKARAAGIHVVLATQRPSVDVITGMIKANFPTRVAFRVAQRVDSRTILDAQGAEYLLGKGDMLVSLNGQNGLRRIQCPFVSEEEVSAVTDFWRSQGEPQFDESILAPRDEDAEPEEVDDALSPKDQEIFDRAVEMVREARKCSTSWLQRRLSLGYQKAARFVDRMERLGIVGPPVGAGKDREILG